MISIFCLLWKYLFITYCLLSISSRCDDDSIFEWHPLKKKELNIGGIFPMIGGWPGGQACLPSAIMALNEVNLNENILQNYRLNLKWYNSEVSKINQKTLYRNF